MHPVQYCIGTALEPNPLNWVKFWNVCERMSASWVINVWENVHHCKICGLYATSLILVIDGHLTWTCHFLQVKFWFLLVPPKNTCTPKLLLICILYSFCVFDRMISSFSFLFSFIFSTSSSSSSSSLFFFIFFFFFIYFLIHYWFLEFKGWALLVPYQF